MAVEAVVAVILEKLTDLLIDDSIAFDNVIDKIEDIRIQLRLMRGFLMDAELSHDPAAVAWATEYLRLLFSAENKIENYILCLAARGRRHIGFFQRRGFTLFAAAYDLWGPGKLLHRELDNLGADVRALELKRPDQVVDTSLRAGSPNSAERDSVKFKYAAPALGRSLSDKLVLAPGILSPARKSGLGSVKTFPSNSQRRSGSRSESPSPRSAASSSPHKHPMPLTTSYADQEGPTLIGFTGDLRLLAERLKGRQGDGVVPLVGPAGCGKTTLAQTIYNLREIKTHFNSRAWVWVPGGSFRIVQVLANLLQQVLKSTEGGGTPNVEQLISRVRESLTDKKYLVVLDGVSEVQYWEGLKPAFPNLGDGGNKVVLITRESNVATFISKQERCRPHHLKKLCHEHSWELFARKSGIDQESNELDDGFRDEILGKSNGCPLDIVLLGGLLSTKGPSFDEWKWYLSQANWCGMEILPLSYNDLPPHSKLCLLYMALFPNEADIHVRRLLRLWLAEGFVRRFPGMSEEDTVEECFDDLVQRNLIKISKLRSDGNPQKCCLPHALRDYLSPIAHQISLFYIHQDQQEPISRASSSVSPKRQELVSDLPVRRVIEYADIKSYNPSPSSASSSSYENLRSYLSFNFQRNDTPAKEVGNFISKIIGDRGFGVLRVLDLEHVYKPNLPETLKQLFHLRYLGLRWTFMDQLPESVGKLRYLETLDLKRTYINCLPSSIWKLEHLRHLNLPGIRLEYNKQKCHKSLTELRTLVGLIVDDETAVKDELSQLCELRELGITCQSSVFEDLMSWIQKLSNLRSLWLKSKDKMGRPSKIKLEPLSMLIQLSHVSLLGNLGRVPTLNEFPPNLKVLSLSVSQLSDDPMAILSALPSLTVLRLLANSYLGAEMKCPRNGFKRLRVLKLWMLKELEKWTVEQDGMPQLRDLNIRYCRKLKQLPTEFLHLEELTLTAMPDEFVEQVKQEKQSCTILTVNDYKFTPLPWENDPDLWQEL